MEAAVVHGCKFSATKISHFGGYLSFTFEKNPTICGQNKQNRSQWRTEAGVVVHGSWFSATEILHFGFLQRKEAEYGCSSSQQIMI